MTDQEFEKQVEEEAQFRIESFRRSIERSIYPNRSVTKKEKDGIRQYVRQLLRNKENESS